MPHLDDRPPSARRQPWHLWRVWGFSLGAAALVASYYLLEAWLFDIQSARGTLVAPSKATLAAVLPWWLTWAVLAPVAVRFVASHPVDRRAPWRTAGLYATAALGFSLVHGAISVPLWVAVLDMPPARGFGAFSGLARIVWWTILRSPTAILQFLTFAAVFHAVAYARALHERELAASRLRTALAHAELDVLKARLEPHFLFNTLNAITSYIRTNPGLAERMVGRLARLLRGVLELRDQQEITLSRELALVEEYLDIQRLRFGERLDTAVEIDTAATTALVPALLLQPLVENAILHGIARRTGRGRVTVSARRDGDVLRLRVEEREGDTERAVQTPVGSSAMTDVGEVRDTHHGAGVGLATTRSRLQQLHGSAQHIALLTGPTGSAVDVTLPFRTVPGEATHG